MELDEFKVGDYVYVIQGLSIDSKKYKNKIKRISEVGHGDSWIHIIGGGTGLWYKEYAQEFRKPTIEELIKAGIIKQLTYELWV